MTHCCSLSSGLAKVWNSLWGEMDLSTQLWGMFLLYIGSLSAACKSAQLEGTSGEQPIHHVEGDGSLSSTQTWFTCHVHTWFTKKTRVQIHKKLKPRDLPFGLIYRKPCLDLSAYSSHFRCSLWLWVCDIKVEIVSGSQSPIARMNNYQAIQLSQCQFNNVNEYRILLIS